jgi:hypothetical protein
MAGGDSGAGFGHERVCKSRGEATSFYAPQGRIPPRRTGVERAGWRPCKG